MITIRIKLFVETEELLSRNTSAKEDRFIELNGAVFEPLSKTRPAGAQATRRHIHEWVSAFHSGKSGSERVGLLGSFVPEPPAESRTSA